MLPTAALMAAVACLPMPDDHPHCAVRRVKVVTAPEVFAEQLARHGFDYLDAGQPADALVAFDASLQLMSGVPFHEWGRATTLAALGRQDDAADAFARMLSFEPNQPILWQLVAQGWADRGKYAEAEACFAQALSFAVSERDQFEMLVREGAAWARATPRQKWPKTMRGGAGRATSTDTQLATAAPERIVRAELAMGRALALDTDGEYNSRADAFRVRGVIRYHLHRVRGAADDADQVLSLSPADAHAHYLRALAAMRLRDTPTALAHLDQAARFDWPAAAVAETRCDVLTDSAEYLKAEEAAREWCRLSPDAYNAFRQHGELLRMLGKDDESDRAAGRAAEIAGRSVFLELMVQVKVLNDHYRHLETVRRTAARLRDRPGLNRQEHLALVYSLVGFRASVGQLKEAFDEVTQAVRMDPHDEHFREVRLTMAVHLSREREAIEDAGALFRLRPHDPEAWKLVRKVRGPEELRAAMAGREPDYRPAGPMAAVPIVVSPPRMWVAEIGERQRGGLR